MSREGVLFVIAGTSLGVLLYILNFTLLMIALIVFIWQRAVYSNTEYHEDLKILEHININDSPNNTPSTLKALTDNEVFLALSKAADNQEVSVTTKPEFAAIKKGAVIEIVSSQGQRASFRALTVEVDHNHVLLRKLPHSEE